MRDIEKRGRSRGPSGQEVKNTKKAKKHLTPKMAEVM